MPNSLIINGSTVINSFLDHAGRIGTFSTAVNVGNTSITPTSITVQSLVVGSISTSGAGGSSTGFNITGNGSFTGALSAGSFSTVGTFSAGNTTFNGTVTLGNISLQNGSITVGATTINTSGMVTNGVGFGGVANIGYYSDSLNLALRPPVASGTVFFQTPGGASSFATFSSTSATVNTPLNINNGSLTVNTGNISMINGAFITDSAGNGGLRFNNGGTYSGFIEFRGANTAAARYGYIGFVPAGGGGINMAAEGTSYFNFTGNAPKINDSPIVSNATLASQLGGYATSAQLSSSLAGYLPLGGGTFSGSATVMFSGSGSGTKYAQSGTDFFVRSIGGNRLQFCDGAATVEYFSFGADGSMSTRQFGDLNSRIEARGQAWGQWAVNQCATGGRWIYAADKGYNDQPGTGGFISPFGGHNMHCDYWSWRFVTADGQTGSAPFAQRFRSYQLLIGGTTWVTSGAAS